MRWLAVLVKGFHGHPLHPPLTDITIGALTVGTLAALLGWLGLREDLLAPTAFVAIVIGLVAALPTVVTGLADFLDIPAGIGARRTAIIHLVLALVSGAIFLAAAFLLQPGVAEGEVTVSGAVAALGGLLVLTATGWVGGALAFVHGVRVLDEPDASTGEALKPRLRE